MTAGTRALGVGETFLSPAALPPPPTRHALFLYRIALAALIHFGTDLLVIFTAKRKPIRGGRARNGSNRRVPFADERQHSAAQKPPLLYWLIVASYELFGVNTAAARVPIALSVVRDRSADICYRRTACETTGAGLPLL